VSEPNEDLSEGSQKQADFEQVLEELLEHEDPVKRPGEVCEGFDTAVTCNTVDPEDKGNNRDCEWNYGTNQCESNPVAELVKMFRQTLKENTITVEGVRFPASQLECLVDVRRATMDEDLEEFLRMMYFTDEEIFGGEIDSYCRKVFKANSPSEVFQKLQEALDQSFSEEIVEELRSHATEADQEWEGAQLAQKERVPKEGYLSRAYKFVKHHASKAANYVGSLGNKK